LPSKKATNKKPSQASKANKPRITKPKKAITGETLFHEGHKLTNHQTAFVKYYCLSWNGTQSAIKAGYSKKTANAISSNLLSNVYIQRAITDECKKIGARMDIQSDRIVNEIQRLAFSDIVNYIDPATGEIDLNKAIKDGVDTSVIQEIITTVSKDGAVHQRVKLYSKEKALEMLSRIKSMFNDTVKHEGNIRLDTVDVKKLTEAQLRTIKKLRDAVKVNGNGGNGQH